MLLIFLHYQHSFPQLAFPEKPRQQATFTPHPAKGTPECTEVSKYLEGHHWVSGGTYMTTEPHLLEDRKWLGVNLVSCANNHASDYGEEGILATISYLDAAGIPHAGTGRNLREARSPAYLDTPRGRVALIAATYTFELGADSGRAAAGYGREGRGESSAPQYHPRYRQARTR